MLMGVFMRMGDISMAVFVRVHMGVFVFMLMLMGKMHIKLCSCYRAAFLPGHVQMIFV